MMTRRAIRRVLPDSVDDAVLLMCIELALRAPSGNNGQNWEFIVVKDGDVWKLAKQICQLWNINCYTMIRRMAARDESMAKTARAAQWQVDNFTEISVLAVACLRRKPLLGPRPRLAARTLPADGAQTGRAATGLGTTPVATHVLARVDAEASGS